MESLGARDEIHRHSGWLIPAGFFLAIVALSGLFLGWYLRPGHKAPAAPTGRSTMVQVTVRGTAFAIPANYMESSAARAGGELDSLALSALFPSWRGFSDSDALLFTGNAPDTPVIRLLLRGDPDNLGEEARLQRIYMPYIGNRNGTAGPFGLTQYGFAKNSGYERNDLFAGHGDKGLVLLLCERAAADLPSPNCLAVDRPLAKNLSFSYRFKRAYLAHWQEISTSTGALIAKFRNS
ncbi:MAG: hypothetical protein NTX21_06295 [Alphaproteobacteria bacterium]|nr:hypothetical protein [Alphaproteobacteria bacterium]